MNFHEERESIIFYKDIQEKSEILAEKIEKYPLRTVEIRKISQKTEKQTSKPKQKKSQSPTIEEHSHHSLSE